MKKLLFPVLLSCFGFVGCQQLLAQKNTVKPHEIWPDDRGMHIQAHGGGLVRINKTYYWYGEERSQGLDPDFRYVCCYSSKDLVNWKFRGDVLKITDPVHCRERWVLERPKREFYNLIHC